jgi:hypothetical protein
MTNVHERAVSFVHYVHSKKRDKHVRMCSGMLPQPLSAHGGRACMGIIEQDGTMEWHVARGHNANCTQGGQE